MKLVYSFLFLIFICSTVFANGQNRQMVMDDAVTFFDAEPVVVKDTTNNRDTDTGWYLKSDLRILGTFPKNSAFRIVVKKAGKEISSIRCEGKVYLKEEQFKNNNRRDIFNLDFEDYMTAERSKCFDKAEVIKEIGKLDVEIYFVEGGSNKETLVRKHKIDVHKLSRVRVSNSIPVPDVSHYFVSRHTESAVAFAFFPPSYTGDNGLYFETQSYVFTAKPNPNSNQQKLSIYSSLSPDGQKNFPINPTAACSLNGQKVTLADEKVWAKINSNRREMATHSRKGFSEQLEFTGMTFVLPFIYRSDELKDGKWECAIVEKGVTFRTFRFEIKNGDLVSHPEQRNGNINLFHKAALVDMEIPKGGTLADFRLLPLPNDGFFYGIPWTTAEGKAMAGSVPKKGIPFPASK
ncbi:MAG: hypothetical protein MUC29_11165 [Pyrinomonadaceae bacterium]|jgi:hypothetical protein|nr:hypothetical protein [Pyrinomonadaceae bacterium]